ncbi:MAG: hypothetical protein ACYC1K_02375 [Minisyncoccota bacterium]
MTGPEGVVEIPAELEQYKSLYANFHVVDPVNYLEELQSIGDRLAASDESFRLKLEEALNPETQVAGDEQKKKAWSYISALSGYGMSLGMTGLD